MTILYKLTVNGTDISRYCIDIKGLESEMMYFLPKIMYKYSKDNGYSFETFKSFEKQYGLYLTFIDHVNSDDIRFFFNEDFSWEIFKEYSKIMTHEHSPYFFD